jgi:hypothetical protein
MSAALQLPAVWEPGNSLRIVGQNRESWKRNPAAEQEVDLQAQGIAAAPAVSLAFYRRHTEKMLRRYLYASMQVGRAPSILGDPVGRGWVSSRPVRTFEDAMIFVLDVETCLNQLGSLDRKMLCRIVIQEHTQAETASLLGMSIRSVSYKFPEALDRLTDKLLKTGLLVLPG